MSVHELLPWYANDTLGPEERLAFEEHLIACSACRAELQWVERMRSKLREAGPAALWDHPSPEALLAAARPEQADVELDPDAARDVRRHLALCMTCADETEWLSGETVAAAGATHPATADPQRRRPVLQWLGLVAALVLIAVLAPFAFRDFAPTQDTPATVIVSSTQRAGSTQTIELLPATSRIELMFEADLGPGDYPARLQLESDGNDLDTVVVASSDELADGLFVVLECPRNACPDGDYTARLIRTTGGPAVEYRFRLETAQEIP